jgi:hypothetical protein
MRDEDEIRRWCWLGREGVELIGRNFRDDFRSYVTYKLSVTGAFSEQIIG